MPETESNLNDTISQVLGVFIRRRWWAILSAGVVALATIAVMTQVPDRFSSEATLMIVQQQVPQKYVEAGNLLATGDAIMALARDVLSRNRLLGIIDQLGLYRKDRERMSPEVLAERLRDQINIEPLDTAPGRNDFKAFKITFTAESARMAQAGNSMLTSLFIEQHLKNQGDQATRTNSFISDQLDAAKKRLAEQEQRLQDFKSRNIGVLPEEQQANFGALSDLRIQLQNVTAGLSRAQQQRGFLELTLSGNLVRLQSKLAGLQSERTALLTRFTPKHAEVIKKDQEIANMQAVLDHLKSGTLGTNDAEDFAALGDLSITQLKSQMDANGVETESLLKEERRLKAEIAQYQNRLNMTPVREQQLAVLLRDLDLYRQDYATLSKNQMQSQMTANLEERQEGQQFKLVDPPTMPVVPSSPKRVKICLGGAAGGIVVGLALAFLMDMKKQCFHDEKELSRSFTMPLLLGVPYLLTPRESRMRAWRKGFEWLAATAVTLVVLVAEFYVYRHG